MDCELASDRIFGRQPRILGSDLSASLLESESWTLPSQIRGLRTRFGHRCELVLIMVKKIRTKAAPFLARSQEDDAKRRATVEEADERWKLMESKKPDPPLGAIEEAFISYSPMSDIVQEEQDDTSVDEILPFEETMSDSGGRHNCQ